MSLRILTAIAATAICLQSALCANPEGHKYSHKQLPVDTDIHFAWGADAGASIDMSAHDMSAIDFNASFGMRRGWINFLGLGLGTQISVSNSSRCYPVFAEFRTNFRDKPSLFFWDLRAGAAYNQTDFGHEYTGFFGFTGAGINLARSNKFTSYMMLGMTYRTGKDHFHNTEVHQPDIYMATCKIGVTF